MTFVGIRYLITSVIRIRDVIVIRIGGLRIRVVVDTPVITRGPVAVVVGILIRRVAMGIPAAIRIRGEAMAIAITRRGVA